MTLPESIDISTRTPAQHGTDHEAIHALVNDIDTSAPTLGDALVWDGAKFAPDAVGGDSSADAWESAGIDKWLLPNDSSDMDTLSNVSWDATRRVWLASVTTSTIDWSQTIQEVLWMEVWIMVSVTPGDLNKAADVVLYEDASRTTVIADMALQNDENVVLYNNTGTAIASTGPNDFGEGSLIRVELLYKRQDNSIGGSAEGPGLNGRVETKGTSPAGASVGGYSAGTTLYPRILLSADWAVLKARSGTW